MTLVCVFSKPMPGGPYTPELSLSTPPEVFVTNIDRILCWVDSQPESVWLCC